MPKRSPGSRPADDINKQFGARLRTLREMAGRSQTEVGQALRVSFQQIQKYENGMTSISLDRLNELARYFTTPVAYLLDGLGPNVRLSGVAESGQASYDAGSSEPTPGVGPLSRDAVTLVNAFNRIRSKRVRRSILTTIEALGADNAEDEASADG